MRYDQARRDINFRDDGTPLPGPEVIQLIRQETDTVLMSFSCGKDSIAAWLAIKDHFPRIVPFYMWPVPGLEFIEESLAYFEEFFGTHIIRVPHPSFYRMLNNLVWQPPERIRIIEAARLPDFDYDMLNELMIKQLDLPESTFVCAGVRAADSPNRRSAINQYGPINWKRKYFYPVWDMYKHELVDLLEQHKVKLPFDYQIFGRSFDGIDYRFLKPLKIHRPADYGRIVEWFPLAELEIMRYETMKVRIPDNEEN